MIGNLTVKVTAAANNLPLAKIYPSTGSANTVIVQGVPAAAAGVTISGVNVALTNADATCLVKSAAAADGEWCATFPASHFTKYGKVANGLQISGVGTDEAGVTRTWVLGTGSVEIIKADAEATEAGSFTNITDKTLKDQSFDLSDGNGIVAAVGTLVEKLGGTALLSLFAAAVLASSTAAAFTPPVYTNVYTADGVTYSQLGGIKASNYVVTATTGGGGGGGSGGISTNDVLDLIAGKQDALTAGENITISTNCKWTTSQYGTAYTLSVPAVGAKVYAFTDEACTTATTSFDTIACTSAGTYVTLKGEEQGQGTVTLVGSNIISASGGGGVTTNDVKGIIAAEVTNKVLSVYYPGRNDRYLKWGDDEVAGELYAHAIINFDSGFGFRIGDDNYDINNLPAYRYEVAQATNNLATKAEVSAKADTSSLSSLAPAAALTSVSNSLNQTAAQVTSIGSYLNAEDAHFVSTNYDSVVRIPEAYVEIKMSNDWITIWREMTRWDKFTGSTFDWTTNNTWEGFAAWKTNVENEIGFKAERSWGIYDSETGGYSPEGYTQVSSSNILIAAGMAYQRTVTTGGDVWVLQCSQGVAQLGGDTNGFFRIMDSDGNVQFEIIKGDKRVIGANATGITVSNATTPPTVTVPYSVVAEEHPTLYCCADLTTANWKAETSSDCVANVTWTGTSGAYVASVQLKSAGTSLFIKATYEAGGETYIRNNAPVGMSSIYLNGTKYYLGTATIDGHTVLTLSTTAPSN